MARPRYARDPGPLPDALPPEDRPVGQLVAEALRLYGRRFWVCLPAGLALALVDQLFKDQPLGVWLAGAPLLLTAGYVACCAVALQRAPGVRPFLVAFAAGVLALLPFPFLFVLYVLPAIAWLALVGLAVPVAFVEGTGIAASFTRAVRLALADFWHALGAVATLSLLYFVCRYALFFLLRESGEQTERAAAFLADLVLGPVVFLGVALLYVDQRERAILGAPSKRRRDAHVPDAVDPHAAGPPDAPGESRAAARGEP